MPLKSVLLEIKKERLRQVRTEGWSKGHDDAHEPGELARAGAQYARFAFSPIETKELPAPFEWPWAEEWWKPKWPRRDLVRAAALIVAELERLDRYAASISPKRKRR